MSEAEWKDGDDPKVRALFGHALRSHVNYQDGRHSEAPALVFADYDYEVGDGACGLHDDGKRCNEPAIVYVRADALIDANDRLTTARDDALEAAAKVAERTSSYGDPVEKAVGMGTSGERVAAAIRALKGSKP